MLHICFANQICWILKKVRTVAATCKQVYEDEVNWSQSKAIFYQAINVFV